MPQFAILIYADESLHALDAAEAELEENDQHARDLQASGSMSLAYALTPRSAAVSIRQSGTTSGPFVQADQFVAGFYVLEAPDLDAATTLARLNPAVRTSTGGVEIRPVHSGGIITNTM
ncbi:YciI family protein [Pseudarthrobacter sp. PS3-L1]|uniref:YciI family protein n=1 Tax=Pseudarthrobacter sp. PS3-L1 TaxID=3046207 RepID=UPI0024BA176B|nr:YciI family protein [Pseudarthrobacter sp. PS3-L1]MDJ0318926.1 YciI family protein [Pseudarthrobacter sp. PS3-L1]